MHLTCSTGPSGCGWVLRHQYTLCSSPQVFKSDQHPAAHQGLGRSKEGLSLYGVVNRTQSTMGKVTLRKWFLQPLTRIEELNERMDAVGFFVEVQNRERVTTLRGYLKHMKDPQPILKRMEQAKRCLKGVSCLDW